MPPVLDGVGVGDGVAVADAVAVAVAVSVAVAVAVAVEVGLGCGVSELLLLDSHPPRAMLSATTIKRVQRGAPGKRKLGRDLFWFFVAIRRHSPMGSSVKRLCGFG